MSKYFKSLTSDPQLRKDLCEKVFVTSSTVTGVLLHVQHPNVKSLDELIFSSIAGGATGWLIGTAAVSLFPYPTFLLGIIPGGKYLYNQFYNE